MTPIVWTTDPPTEPGWYWATERGEEDAVVEVIMDISGPCVWMPTPPEAE